MLIRGIGESSQSYAWLGTAGHHHQGSRRRRAIQLPQPIRTLGISCHRVVYLQLPVSSLQYALLRCGQALSSSYELHPGATLRNFSTRRGRTKAGPGATPDDYVMAAEFRRIEKG
jgi:hypothetical protein